MSVFVRDQLCFEDPRGLCLLSVDRCSACCLINDFYVLLLFSLDATPQSKLHLFLFVRWWGHVSRTDVCTSHLKVVKVAYDLLIKLLRAQVQSILTEKQLRQIIDQLELPEVLISLLFLLGQAHHLVAFSMTALAHITCSLDQVIIQEVVDLNLRLVALMSYFITAM